MIQKTQRRPACAALCMSRLLVTDKPCETDLIEFSFSFSSFSVYITRLELMLLAVGCMLALVAVNIAGHRFLFRREKRDPFIFLVLLSLKYAVPFMLLDTVLINGTGLRITSLALAFIAYLVFSGCFLLENVVFLFGANETDRVVVPAPGGPLRVSWGQLLAGMTIALWALIGLALGSHVDE